MRSDETKTVIYELIFEGVDYAALRALVTFKKNGKKSEHLAVLVMKSGFAWSAEAIKCLVSKAA